MTLRRLRCDNCDLKIPKQQPKLKCTICDNYKHLSCQKLTKADARLLIDSDIPWSCRECIENVLPVNACEKSKISTNNTAKKFKIKCSSCNGFSYSRQNVRTCGYCNNLVHLKCWNNSLGCNSCCENMIPGFHGYSYELLGDPCLKNNKIFNPYSRHHNTQLIGNIIDTEEQHNNFFSEVSELLISCKYKQPNIAKMPTNNELSVLSLNVQGLLSKMDELRENIVLYEKFDVLLFNETNFKPKKLPDGTSDITPITLEGFHDPIVQEPIRKSGKGGGLVAYVNKRVCEADDIEIFIPYEEAENVSGEFQFIKIKNCKYNRKTIILANVYRSPSCKPKKFNEFFNTLLQKLDCNRYSNKTIFIMGDFNQDLIQYDDNVDCQNLVDNAHSHGFSQIVSRPTRITENSATLIDHVYSNSVNNALSCNILTLDLSDHLAIHTKILINSNTNLSQKTSNGKTKDNSDFRIFNEANNLVFEQLIDDEIWEDIGDELDAQESYNKFEEIYLKHYDSAYPLKSTYKRRKNERENPKPWILPWLEDACARKNRLYHVFVKNPTPENKSKYKKLNEFCKKHIGIAKTKYYKSYFEKYKENSRKQWQFINGLLNRTKKRTSISNLVDSKGNTINTPNGIAESFNDYFSNIATNLKKKINDPSIGSILNSESYNYQDFLKNPSNRDMNLEIVTGGEVYNVICNFKNKSTLGAKMSALKIANKSIGFTYTLASIINKSFQEGIFPDQMKNARVIPLHKEGSKSDVSNYRPISLLNSFSKIYEKLMHIRILKFLESNNSIYENQYGFRPGRCCEHALLNAQNSILDSLTKRKISLLLFIDFSKAFDMVEHEILLKKLEYYGIRGIALAWLKSYLSDRKQFVSVNGTDSTKQVIKHGVPQGSILGPLLFVIYINDIPNIATFAKFILYADDANILITASTIEEIHDQLTNLITKLLEWVNSNGLALNLKKTNYMIFSRSNVDLPKPLSISNIPIERKTEARFLGVIIDETLNWTRHVKTVISKMSRYVGIMYKLKKFLPLKVRLQIYHSFIQSHLNFCSLVWGFCSKSNIEAIFSKQKIGMRAVVPGFINYKFKDGEIPGHTKAAFSEYKILTVHNLITLNSFIFMRKVRNFPCLLPFSILNTISEESPVYGSNEETCTNWLETYNTHIYRKSLFCKGPLLFISDEIYAKLDPDSLDSLPAYKTELKKVILNLQGSGEPTEWQNDNFPLYNISGLRKSNRNAEITKYMNYYSN